MLEQKFLEKWLEGLKTAWLNKDIDGAVKFFDKTTLYLEDPFSKARYDINGIRELWEEIVKQDIFSLVLDIIAIDGLTAVIHYHLEYREIGEKTETLLKSDGLYVIKFDENLNCIEFRQWWMMKN